MSNDPIHKHWRTGWLQDEIRAAKTDRILQLAADARAMLGNNTFYNAYWGVHDVKLPAPSEWVQRILR